MFETLDDEMSAPARQPSCRSTLSYNPLVAYRMLPPAAKMGDMLVYSDTMLPPNTIVGLPEGFVVVGQIHDETIYALDPAAPSVWKAPCRCPSLLAGHEVGCAWHPAPDERELEKARLEQTWGILQPRKAPSYETAADRGQEIALRLISIMGVT